MKINLVKQLYNYSLNSLGAEKYRNGWLRTSCPTCGKKNKFGINPYQNRTNCFSCGYNPKLVQLIGEVEKHRTLSETLSFLESGNFGSAKIDYSELEVKNEVSNIEPPESFRLINVGRDLYSRLARKFLKDRGFDILQLAILGVGYCSNGKYAGYIIIPYMESGKLIYFNARTFMKHSTKYLNVSGDEVRLGKSLIWYNSQALYNYKTVYVLEGAFNAITMGQNAIASAGKMISDNQVSHLIRSEVDNFIIMLDDDAYQQSIELALLLVDHKNVKIVKFPTKKDANDLGRVKSKGLAIKSRYLNKQQLLKLKHTWENQ